MKPILNICDLTISYRQGAPAVEHLDLSLNEGEILALAGGSGSGKSTVLSAIIGLMRDGLAEVEGRIEFKDRNLLENTEDEWNRCCGKDISMIFQNTAASMNPNRRIENQILEYAGIHSDLSRSEILDETKKLMKKLRLTDPDRVLHSYPFQLSGGMQQRVAIAMSMLLRPSLILADEPTSALDVTVQAQVASQIKMLKEEYHTSVIFVTHNMGVASFVADRIAVMEKGRMIEIGTRDEVINHPKCAYTKALLAAVPEFGGVL